MHYSCLFNSIKKWGIPIVCTLIITVYPTLFLYFNNADEAAFSEVIEPLINFCGIGIVLFVTNLIFIHEPQKTTLSTAVCLLTFLNFSLIEHGILAVFPNLNYWHTVSIVMAFCIYAAMLIRDFMKEEFAQLVVGIVSLIFGVLIVLNGVIGIPRLINRIQSESTLKSGKFYNNDVSENSFNNSINIYLLIFDEYAGFNQIRNYYNYDNSILENYLLNNQFTISYGSHNESIITTTIITNLMNLDYVVDDQTSTNDKEVIRKNGQVFSLMQEKGYDIQIVENGTFLRREVMDNITTQSGAMTVNGESMAFLLYKKTLFYPFYTLNSDYRLKQITDMVNYLESDTIIQDKPTFTIAYFVFPHTPFIVDEHGNAIPSKQYFNWEDDRYYLGQYKYATTLMMRIIDNIISKDPNSIIMLQSDHGARGRTDIPLEFINNPLNAVYYCGEPTNEIKDQSSVNTMRIVLSKLFGISLDVIKVPEAA